jgi:hypothetical protein
MPTQEELVAQLRARHAAAVARGDPYAIKLQAARERAEAEQRWYEQRERERLFKLLGLVPNSTKQKSRQKAEALVTAIDEIRRQTGNLRKALEIYSGAKAGETKFENAERRYWRARRTISD